MHIAHMSSWWTRLQIGFDPCDPMVELNGRDRLVEFIDVSTRITRKETMAEIRIFVGGESAVLQYSSFETFLHV